MQTSSSKLSVFYYLETNDSHCWYRRLHVHIDSEEDLFTWRREFLANLRDCNADYRSSALRMIRATSRKARFANAAENLSQYTEEVIKVGESIRLEVMKVPKVAISTLKPSLTCPLDVVFL